VACIDDSATVQRSVKLILESVGYRVNSITQTLTALSSLGREVPDLILLDINMPDMDGYSLCRLLRQCSALKEVPIIMLTGRDAILDKVRAKLLGASEYLTKPFEPQVLIDMISGYVSLEIVA
jgi:twitching motility two-component system response regulator PilG